MDMRWSPRIVVIAPGIRARFDGLELVAPFSVGHYAPAPVEMRIEWRVRLIVPVPVTTTGVRLPKLQQGARNLLAIFIEHATAHQDSRTDRFATVGKSHIVIARRNCIVPENRTGDFRKRVGQKYQRLRRSALH